MFPWWFIRLTLLNQQISNRKSVNLLILSYRMRQISIVTVCLFEFQPKKYNNANKQIYTLHILSRIIFHHHTTTNSARGFNSQSKYIINNIQDTVSVKTRLMTNNYRAQINEDVGKRVGNYFIIKEKFKIRGRREGYKMTKGVRDIKVR